MDTDTPSRMWVTPLYITLHRADMGSLPAEFGRCNEQQCRLRVSPWYVCALGQIPRGEVLPREESDNPQSRSGLEWSLLFKYKESSLFHIDSSILISVGQIIWKYYLHTYTPSSILNTGLVVTSVPYSTMKRESPFLPDLTPVSQRLLQNCAGLFSFKAASSKLARDEFKMDNLAH